MFCIGYQKINFGLMRLYELFLCKPLKAIGNFLWNKGDIGVIDKFGPDGITYICRKLASKVKIISKWICLPLCLYNVFWINCFI